MCLYSRLIQNPKYKPNKKNGGKVPPIMDERVKYVPIGCMECIECTRQKQREWMIRLQEDIKKHKNAKFITFTFSNESIKEIIDQPATKKWPGLRGVEGYTLDNAIATRAMRLFLERWRKKYKKSLRHWTVTELGHNGTENIHLHGIIWTDESMDEVEKIWQYGHVWKGKKIQGEKLLNYVNNKTVNYIVKYIGKKDFKHKEYKSIMLTSAGIGGNYMKRSDWKNNRYVKGKTDEAYRTQSGHKIALPKYLRNKIYSEEEREKLWIEKLDKQERWVDGVRVDIRKGEETYFKILEEARKKNKRLGYGNGEVNWERKQYEEQIRRLRVNERIEQIYMRKNYKKVA